MPRASAVGCNAALAGLSGNGSTNVVPFLAAHIGDPGTTGANENANTGSYARQAVTWNAPGGSAMTNASSVTFNTLGTVPVTAFGCWSSATYGAGTYAIGMLAGSSVTAAVIVAAAGAVSLIAA